MFMYPVILYCYLTYVDTTCMLIILIYKTGSSSQQQESGQGKISTPLIISQESQ